MRAERRVPTRKVGTFWRFFSVGRFWGHTLWSEDGQHHQPSIMMCVELRSSRPKSLSGSGIKRNFQQTLAGVTFEGQLRLKYLMADAAWRGPLDLQRDKRPA